MTTNDKSTESVLDIEYIPSQSKPTPNHTTPHPDWIASITANDTSQLIVTGGFDGKARIWDYGSKLVGQIEGHGKNNKGVKAIGVKSRGVDEVIVLAGGVDSSANVGGWQVCEGHPLSFQLILSKKLIIYRTLRYRDKPLPSCMML